MIWYDDEDDDEGEDEDEDDEEDDEEGPTFFMKLLTICRAWYSHVWTIMCGF